MTTKQAQLLEIGEKLFPLIADRFNFGEKLEVHFTFDEQGRFETKLYRRDFYEIDFDLEDD